MATVVERISRHAVIFRNNDRRFKPLMDNLINLLSPLPRHARQSLTFDRGLEKGLGAQALPLEDQRTFHTAVCSVMHRLRRQ